VTLVLDAGALVAIDRGQRELIALLKWERLSGRVPVTHGGVVGQVWRGGRQARLAMLLPALDVRSLDEVFGRRAGVLLARSRTSDVIDAAVVLLAGNADIIITSDRRDILVLLEASGADAEVVSV